MPDPSPTFSSPEEVIEYVRNKRSSIDGTLTGIANRNANIGEATFSQYSSSRTTAANDGRTSTNSAQFPVRKIQVPGEFSGSDNSTSGKSRQFDNRVTTNNGGSNEYVRPMEQTTRSTNYPIKKSIFSTFNETIKDARKALGGDTSKTMPSAKPKPIGKVFTDTEAARMKPVVIQCIMWTSIHLDQFIIATTPRHDNSLIIWSDIDEELAEVLASALLSRARVDPRAARLTRNMVELYDRIKVVVIITPRMYRTLLYYLHEGISVK